MCALSHIPLSREVQLEPPASTELSVQKVTFIFLQEFSPTMSTLSGNRIQMRAVWSL